MNRSEFWSKIQTCWAGLGWTGLNSDPKFRPVEQACWTGLNSSSTSLNSDPKFRPVEQGWMNRSEFWSKIQTCWAGLHEQVWILIQNSDLLSRAGWTGLNSDPKFRPVEQACWTGLNSSSTSLNSDPKFRPVEQGWMNRSEFWSKIQTCWAGLDEQVWILIQNSDLLSRAGWTGLNSDPKFRPVEQGWMNRSEFWSKIQTCWAGWMNRSEFWSKIQTCWAGWMNRSEFWSKIQTCWAGLLNRSEFWSKIQTCWAGLDEQVWILIQNSDLMSRLVEQVWILVQQVWILIQNSDLLSRAGWTGLNSSSTGLNSDPKFRPVEQAGWTGLNSDPKFRPVEPRLMNRSEF